jgi:N-acetylmuramoyl-L-alanine amidase
MEVFTADSFVVADVVPSPNHDERADNRPPDMVLMHYTGMQDGPSALDRLCSADSKVSAHYVVFEDGRIVQCVPEARRAWHAGVSFWAGETDINSRAIGIEVVNPGHDYGYPDFPISQIAAVISLCRSILSRHRIVSDRVLAHSDVAPARKQDPGEKFPWGLLSHSRVGHWVKPEPAAQDSRAFRPGDSGEDVQRLQRALASYGYGIADTGQYDEQTAIVMTAFQRHFRPEKIDGIADTSTLQTLRALLETRPIF